jgi:hypothetical protein
MIYFEFSFYPEGRKKKDTKVAVVQKEKECDW